MTTTIQIGVNDDEENAQKQQRRRHLINNRRSAFIPEENDGKQFISKDESEFLRDSILRVNRPRISRPWFDQPSAPQNGTIKGSIRSNSSSGCSSNPQSSGPSSPTSSKCSSENGTAEQQQRKTTTMENGTGGNRTPAELKLEKSPPKMLSASLVQKVAANSNSLTIRSMPVTATAASNLPSSSPSNAKIPSNSKQIPNLPLLKRKEFPSHQRRVPMPPPQKNLLLPNQQKCQYVHENRFVTGGGRRIMDPAEEVEELSRAARKQMAILEELEVEDRERKTRIVGNNNNNRTESRECVQMDSTSVDSPTSSRESTTTRLSSTSSSAFSSTSTTASPFVPNNGHRPSCSPSTSSASSSLTNNEWSPGIVHSKYGENKIGGLPQLLVEDITRRRQKLAKNGENEMQKGERDEKQIPKFEMNKNGNDGNNPRKLLECAGCGGMIQDVILQALGSSFHPACFRCSKCGKCLDGIPFAVEQGGTVICMEDYEQHFVPHCHGCHQPINAVNEFGQVVRVVIKDREFHIHSYSCEGCGMQLSNEEPGRCFPLQDHLLCRRCNTLWRRMGALDLSEAAISDL